MGANLCLGCARRQVVPRAVKVGCLHSDPQVDQHLCRFNAVSLHRDSWHNGPDAGEHFAADLPGIVSSAPRIGCLGTGKCLADGIHYLTTHRFALRRCFRPTPKRAFAAGLLTGREEAHENEALLNAINGYTKLVKAKSFWFELGDLGPKRTCALS